MGTRYYLETYGCSLNTSDSDLIAGRLRKLESLRVTELDEAEVLIFNTCGVKEPTEDRIIHRLEEVSRLGKPVIVAGCLPRISLKRVKKAIPSFAAILGPQSIESLGAILKRVLSGERGIVHLSSDESSKLSYFEGPPNTTICTVPICEGCLGSCAYCAVRFARGPVRSYQIDELVDIVERCVHLGYREIRLTSQDAGVFGDDTGETLPTLLHKLDLIEGSHRFRLGMFNPNLVLDSLNELLEAMSSDHYFRFFHVPLQSGSDQILQKMKRQYTVDEWTSIVHKISDSFPMGTIATDIIVGFPGETNEDFEQTMDVIKQIRPAVVNISKYGDRPGTVASRSREKVDTGIKKDRSRALSSLVAEISLESNQRWTRWSGMVLVTKPGSKGGHVCRNESYRPIIVDDDLTAGELVNVRVVSAKRTHLIGEVTS
ncbi:MAG: tRNA (N(6)-L-threonylcarbamoyladenosine(37)-C(2))-methylthiotransferase [Candidatus Thorarchaeota archaeon]